MSLPASNSQWVLVSGVNGMIASETTKQFLDAGYSVRGTVRSLGSSAELLKVLDLYVQAGRFEIVELKDITIPGAFDEAKPGVHAIAHMASPVSQFFTDPEPVIKTAKAGTATILESALYHAGPQLNSVVLISSIGAVISGTHPAPYTYTEHDWNDFSLAEVARLGNKTPGGHIYRASKTASEHVFWDFRKEYTPNFTMTTVNPAYVSGPPLVPPKDPANINETVRAVWTILSGQPIPESLGGSGAFVDIRDVARLMVFAVQQSTTADGKRYIAVGGVGGNQAIADILRKHYPSRNIDVGDPGKGYTLSYGFPPGGIAIDTNLAEKDSGRGWIGFENSTVDAAKIFERYL